MTKIEKKLYYSIGEISKFLNVNSSLIRYWEKEFDVIRPKKNSKGNRIFTQNDLDNIKLIYHLLKEKKFTIDGAKKKIRENKFGVKKNFEIIQNNTKDIISSGIARGFAQYDVGESEFNNEDMKKSMTRNATKNALQIMVSKVESSIASLDDN